MGETRASARDREGERKREAGGGEERGERGEERTGLGETLKALDELREVLGVLALNGDADDRRHRELHHLDVVGGGEGRDRSGLDQELVHTDETDDVAGRARVEGLDVAAHHEDGALDGLEEEVLLLARDVVRAHDPDLEAGGDGAGEDAAEGVEAALVRGGDHLRDVHHERGVGVAVRHALADLVVDRALVELARAVFAGGNRRREVDGDHLEERVAGREPCRFSMLRELATASELQEPISIRRARRTGTRHQTLVKHAICVRSRTSYEKQNML